MGKGEVGHSGGKGPSCPLQPLSRQTAWLYGLLCRHTGPGDLSLWKRPGLSLTRGGFCPLVHALVANARCVACDSEKTSPFSEQFSTRVGTWIQPWVCEEMPLQLVHMRSCGQDKGCVISTRETAADTNTWDLPASFITCRMKGVCLLPIPCKEQTL